MNLQIKREKKQEYQEVYLKEPLISCLMHYHQMNWCMEWMDPFFPLDACF